MLKTCMISSIEEKIYKHWIKKGYFYSVPNEKLSYTIILPPPNVTGILHMGHILNNTLQDVLIRRARMQGYNVCWLPGTDHASIATEAKIIAQFQNEENKTKYQLNRNYFLERSWEWSYKQEYYIFNQLQKLGCSCDWKRISFTMDKERDRSVINCFIELYSRGLIYRDYRLVNWDTQAKTTISNEEVHYQEQKISLYYIQYSIVNIKKCNLIISTTRPETIFGDTGVCINTKDNRYTFLIGEQAIIPIIDRIIPIIKDNYVDERFGAGVSKITPAHDTNDFILGKIHSLDFIDLFNENGTINKNGIHFLGKECFKARKELVDEFHKKGILVKIEIYSHNIAFSERTHSIIETRRSIQWYLKTKILAKPALTSVIKGNIHFYPKNFKNIYFFWMKNVQDWNISRQLWWGHKIPVYYYGKYHEKYVVAKTKTEAISLLKNKTISIENLIQDDDVLDTWFSSWIWPISILCGFCFPKNKNILYYYPTKVLITGPDILFFWVARMIMAGYAFLNKRPFDNVYFTGIVRDFKGKKMSKSIGNSPDPIKLIKKYGSDGVRIGLLLSALAGNDLLFKEELCLQGRNFSNKIWNIFRLMYILNIDNFIETSYNSYLSIEWFEHLLSKIIYTIDHNFKNYSISKALNKIYKFIWNDLCSKYLEIIKTTKVTSQFVWYKTFKFIEIILKLLHPYMPYITENLWHIIKNRPDNESLIISNWPIIKNNSYKHEYFKYAEKFVIFIRNVRTINGMSLKNPILIYSTLYKKNHIAIAFKILNISQIYYTIEKPKNYQFSFLIDSQEFFLCFYEEEKKTYAEKIKNFKNKIEYYSVFLSTIKKTLALKSFISNAQQKIVNIERKKFTDILEKIQSLKCNKIENLY